MRLLDLFCGAGGAAVGYHRAGFADIIGVDINPQPRFPFRFIQADALDYLAAHGHEFDVIHASPPCQGYSALRHLPWLQNREWPMLIKPVRELLMSFDKPYIIENVEGAPLLNGITMCGYTMGIGVYRHRQFESNILLLSPPHRKHDIVIGSGRNVNDRKKGSLNNTSAKGAWGQQQIITVAGNQFKKTDGERAMGINWMTKYELTQAIPPAYTEFIGRQLRGYLR